MDLATIVGSKNFWVQHIPWKYGIELHQEGDIIEVAFHPLPMADIMASVTVVHNEPDKCHQMKPVKDLTPHLDPVPMPKQQTLISRKK